MNGAANLAAFDAPKLRTLTETLERRVDDLLATLDATIADVEAGALEPRLTGWLAWLLQRRRNGALRIAVGGERAAERIAEARSGGALPARIELIEAVEPADAFALGELRRDCAGAVWLGTPDTLSPPLLDVFRESPLGTYCTRPGDGARPAAGEGPWSSLALPGRYTSLAELLGALLPEPAVPAVAALVDARLTIELAAGCQAEHARENVRLALQAAIAERTKTAHAFADELAARRELTAQIRDDLNRDLQGSLERLARGAAQLDSDLAFRGPAKRAMDAVPALSTAPGKLVRVDDFEEEDRFHWWTGSVWERFALMFPRKMRLTLRDADLHALSAELTAQVVALVSKQALRVVDAFNESVTDFDAVTRGAGIELAPAAIAPDERARWDRKATSVTAPFSGSFGGAAAALGERAKRAIDTACEKDVKTFHVDIERKGPIGRIMEARTAVMGMSFLVMTGIRVSGAWGNIQNWMTSSSHPGGAANAAAAHGVPWNLIFNAALIGVFFIFVGLVVNAITESGKEGAQISEKVHEARDALEEKLVSVMERFVASELGELKTLVTEHKATALERLDRALDAQKQEIEETDRKSRTGASPLRASRPGLAPLPIGLKSEVEKNAVAAKDLRAEVSARYVALATPVIAPPPAAASSTTAAIAARPAVAPRLRSPEASAALDALAARAAAREAAAAARAAEAGS